MTLCNLQDKAHIYNHAFSEPVAYLISVLEDCVVIETNASSSLYRKINSQTI